MLIKNNGLLPKHIPVTRSVKKDCLVRENFSCHRNAFVST